MSIIPQKIPAVLSFELLTAILFSAVICNTAATEISAQSINDDAAIAEESSPSDRTLTKEATEKSETTDQKTEEASLQFSFRFSPWEDVLDWIAEESELSLMNDVIPAGTFNYIDKRPKTHAQAMDIINRSLLLRGYTLIVKDKMLLVIDLEDEIAPKLIRDLVARVQIKDLDSIGEYSLAKCLFTLQHMTPEEAQLQLEEFLGPQGSIFVIPKLGQLLVTETGGKLRTIRDILEKVDSPSVAGLRPFVLKNITAEEVMMVARQLLNIPEDASAAEDGSIRLASDSFGSRLFVTGTPEKVALVEQIIQELDTELASGSLANPAILETPQFMVHPVNSADPQAVLRVIQTLFAGDSDTRLEVLPNSGNLGALARPSQHATIRATIAQLEQDRQRIEVIPLRTLDPLVAVTSITKFFVNEEDSSAPKVDADPIQRNLMVYGTEQQISQVRTLLQGMGENIQGSSAIRPAQRGNVRMIPLSEDAARAALEQIQRIWPSMRGNSIQVVTPSAVIHEMRSRRQSSDTPPGTPRSPADPPAATPSPSVSPSQIRPLFEAPPTENPPKSTSTPLENIDDRIVKQIIPSRKYFFTSQLQELPPPASTATPDENDTSPEVTSQPEKAASKLADIIVAPGPQGMMIACDDLEALDAFQKLLSTISSQSISNKQQYYVFYLSYIQADAAATLLNQLVSGTSPTAASNSSLSDAAKKTLDGLGGGLIGSMLSSSGTGSLALGSSLSIVPDNRLNSLVVQGSYSEINQIEQLLKVIDRESGPVEVLTNYRARMIYLYNSSAEDVAKIIGDVFSTRMANTQGNQNSRRPSPGDFFRGFRGGGDDRGRGGRDSGRGGGSNSTQEPKMTVGVDLRKNAVIVSAPDPLFQEVERLVIELDTYTEPTEAVSVVTIKRANPELVQQAIAGMLGENLSASTSSSSSSSNRGSSSRGSTNSRGGSFSTRSPEEMQRRIEFFRSLRGGGSSQGDRGSRDGPTRGGGSSRGSGRSGR